MYSVYCLNKKIKDLTKEIETIISTPPLEVDINSCRINNFQKSLEEIAENKLNEKTNNIEKKLFQMGQGRSSNALGAAIAISRERAEKYIDIKRKTNDYAIQEKNNIIDQKKSVLEIVINERDKERQQTFNYIKTFLTSGVIIAALNVYSNEIKGILVAVKEFIKSST